MFALCSLFVVSSANAKKWEAELQTLRNNNARLTSALQESASNVDEWSRQLQLYKDENNRLRSQVSEVTCWLPVCSLTVISGRSLVLLPVVSLIFTCLLINRLQVTSSVLLALESNSWFSKNASRPLVRISVLCSLQCFDTDALMAGRTLVLWKTHSANSRMFFFHNRWRRRTQVELADPCSPRTMTIMWTEVGCIQISSCFVQWPICHVNCWCVCKLLFTMVILCRVHIWFVLFLYLILCSWQVQSAENSTTAAESALQRQLAETVDKLQRTEQMLTDTQKVSVICSTVAMPSCLMLRSECLVQGAYMWDKTLKQIC